MIYVRICLESLKKCIETGKPAAPFKDCGALIDHTNEQVKLIEQAMQDHFSSIFKEMETASEGFKKNRITSEIKEKLKKSKFDLLTNENDFLVKNLKKAGQSICLPK